MEALREGGSSGFSPVELRCLRDIHGEVSSDCWMVESRAQEKGLSSSYRFGAGGVFTI